MKRILFLAIILFAAFLFNANSQENRQMKTEEFPVLKPTFIVSDIYIAVQILEGIDLKGQEVDAFLEVKKTLNAYMLTAQDKKMKVGDPMKVDLPANIAQNTLTFLGRATLKGNMADAYKRFVDAIVESSKNTK